MVAKNFFRSENIECAPIDWLGPKLGNRVAVTHYVAVVSRADCPPREKPRRASAVTLGGTVSGSGHSIEPDEYHTIPTAERPGLSGANERSAGWFAQP